MWDSGGMWEEAPSAVGEEGEPQQADVAMADAKKEGDAESSAPPNPAEAAGAEAASEAWKEPPLRGSRHCSTTFTITASNTAALANRLKTSFGSSRMKR